MSLPLWGTLEQGQMLELIKAKHAQSVGAASGVLSVASSLAGVRGISRAGFPQGELATRQYC